ncbi:hypothetical protein F4813DRAFT_388032 [Daldinia decipiens]|uniref:uncharacterized protein n=1 Tax=Daldinia decipiens TaxID=326647 RepID=UPI0020C37831|nr:uncharacterized protein F4813DRAFT_388032 [Daldinia decipiens]KAI1659325.1 hypothetical protein F4813DRAFT_388032 [Daldinia decipiens]
MDSILDTRVPKGGSGFKYKGGGGSSGGGGGGGGGSLAWWVWLIIICSVVWLFAYITLFVHFFRTDYIRANSSERPRFGLRLFGRLAWKAFRYATGIQIFVWVFRKIRSKTDRDTKKVGDSFYRKIDEEERGMKSGNEQSAMPPAQLRHEPAPPPAYSNTAIR